MTLVSVTVTGHGHVLLRQESGHVRIDVENAKWMEIGIKGTASLSIKRVAGNGITVSVIAMGPGSAQKSMPSGPVRSSVETV